MKGRSSRKKPEQEKKEEKVEVMPQAKPYLEALSRAWELVNERRAVRREWAEEWSMRLNRAPHDDSLFPLLKRLEEEAKGQ